MILRIHHAQVGIPRDGLAKAREFYCDLLGLKEVHRPFGPDGFWVQVGDRNVHFGFDDVHERRASRAHVAYEVSDVAAVKKLLQTAGFAVENPPVMPGYVRFHVRDPFGNQVEFIEKA